MELQPIKMSQYEARSLWRDYHQHREKATPIDKEIARLYHAIGRGEVVINAHQAVIDAGVNAQGLPKLALLRADASECHLRLGTDGSGDMDNNNSRSHYMRGGHYDFPRDSFPRPSEWRYARAAVPHIPPKHRPARLTLGDYDILWEAEWKKIPPADPVLLRRIGKSFGWIVVAAWDLTEVERFAMASRL